MPLFDAGGAKAGESVQELCDGLDNDCDVEIDEELTAPEADLTDGVCAGQVKVCAGFGGWVEPDYENIEGYEFFEEACWEGVTNKHRIAAGRIAISAGERRIHTHEEQQ